MGTIFFFSFFTSFCSISLKYWKLHYRRSIGSFTVKRRHFKTREYFWMDSSKPEQGQKSDYQKRHVFILFFEVTFLTHESLPGLSMDHSIFNKHRNQSSVLNNHASFPGFLLTEERGCFTEFEPKSSKGTDSIFLKSKMGLIFQVVSSLQELPEGSKPMIQCKVSFPIFHSLLQWFHGTHSLSNLKCQCHYFENRPTFQRPVG